jgi:WD40 repeat protein
MWRPEHPMFFPGDSVRTVVWTHDGRQVLTGSLRTWTERRGVVRRWDVATGELIGRALVVDGGVMCLLIDSRAEVVMALSGKRDSGHLHVVSRRGGELSADGTTIDTGLGLPIDGRVLDDGRVVAAGEEGGIVVCDLTTGVVEQRWPVVPPELGPAGPGYLQAVCATPDGRTIWCGGSSGFLHRFDRRVDGTYAEVAPRYLGEFIRALQYVDDDSLLVGLANGILYRLRRDGTGPPLTFAGHQGDVTDVDWVRRNGELLVASGDWSGNVRLWRGDGSLHREIRAHSGPVLSVRFSPQGDRLLTGADDGTARIWRVDLELPR